MSDDIFANIAEPTYITKKQHGHYVVFQKFDEKETPIYTFDNPASKKTVKRLMEL
jgi:hypothetical protein